MSFGHLSRAGGCLPSADDLVESPDVQVLFCSRGQGLRERRLGRRRGTSAKKTQTSGPLSRSLPVCPHPFPPSSSRHPGSLAPSLSDSGLPDLPPSIRSPSPQSPFLSADVWIPGPSFRHRSLGFQVPFGEEPRVLSPAQWSGKRARMG